MYVEIVAGDVVKCDCGRDRGYFAVMRTEGRFCYLADGARRRVETPKKKNRKHTEYAGRLPEEIVGQIERGEKVGNARLKRLLSRYKNAEAAADR